MTQLLAILLIIAVALMWNLAAETSIAELGLLDADNECNSNDTVVDHCALNALQQRSRSMTMAFDSDPNSESGIGGKSFPSPTTRATFATPPRVIPTTTPPKYAMEYNGMAWPNMTIKGKHGIHIFAIGDWGGLDGTLKPSPGHSRLVIYKGGHRKGPHVFPRTRWNRAHSHLLCTHKEFVTCYNTRGWLPCNPACGFRRGVDDRAQLLVAKAMRKRARKVKPAFVLNVGDNFYWAGIEKDCGTPMNHLSYTAKHQFDNVFESVYYGKELERAPWFSVLGNHDWGGFRFTNGWDQQIAYTWHSKRWVMPAAFYSAHVDFVDHDFSVDLFMLDSNALDADDLFKDPDHNICSGKHNSKSSSCASQGGPVSAEACKQWFWDLWGQQQAWLKQRLNESTATWQIAVTHFPCGHHKHFYTKMHQQYGLDLLVTGHRHDQELWHPRRLGGLACFVTGGGGGISSESSPLLSRKREWHGEAQYGFYDLHIKKTSLKITSVNWNGYVPKSLKIYPKSIPPPFIATSNSSDQGQANTQDDAADDDHGAVASVPAPAAAVDDEIN